MNSPTLTRILPTPLVLGLVGGLIATLFWVIITTEGSAVPETPHHVPVAVIGPANATARIAGQLDHDGAFRVIPVGSEHRALQLVDRRRADAVVNLATHELQTADAGSSLSAVALEQIFDSPTSRLQLHATDIRPLTTGDPTPLGLLFITMSFALGGLPAGIAFSLLRRSRRPDSLADATSWALAIVVFSGLQALLVALLADAILGYGGAHMLAIWGFGTIFGVACMAGVVAGIALLGLAGALIPVIPILYFGVPSAPVPTPWNWNAGIFRVLGPFDPLGATADAIRNNIFFGAASQAQNRAVLLVWAAVPVVIIVLIGWLHQRSPRSELDQRGASPLTELEPVA